MLAVVAKDGRRDRDDSVEPFTSSNESGRVLL